MPHYPNYLAPLLNSRRALKKLRDVLNSSAEQGNCLAGIADTLLARISVQIQANPGSLSNRLDSSLGIVTQVDEDGQVKGATTVVVDDRNNSEEFLKTGNGYWNLFGIWILEFGIFPGMCAFYLCGTVPVA